MKLKLFVLLAVANLVPCSGALADYLDTTGIPNYIDRQVNQEIWHFPLMTKDGERDLQWQTSVTYEIRVEGGSHAEAGEQGFLRMNNGQWALLSLSGRQDRGYYQYVGTHKYVSPANGTTYIGKVMYIWSKDGPSVWTTWPRSASDKSLPAPPAEHPSLTAKPPDQKIVGTWVGYVNTVKGKYQSKLEIAPEGRYSWTFENGGKSFTQTGLFVAEHGKWFIQPDHDAFDQGTYSVEWYQPESRFIFTMASKQFGSPLQSIVWQRKIQ